MTSKLDVFKSMLRSAALGASNALRNLPVTGAARQAVEDLLSGRGRIPEERLSAAVARLPGVSSASVSCTPPELRIDASYTDGRRLELAFVPTTVRFAPQGAKEIGASVHPAEATTDPRAAELFSAVAGEVARSLWGPVLGARQPDAHSAFVHRDADSLHVDLRTVPEVRAAIGQRVPALMVEALRLIALHVDTGSLRLSVGLPSIQV
jgi:hypothetical protein